MSVPPICEVKGCACHAKRLDIFCIQPWVRLKGDMMRSLEYLHQHDPYSDKFIQLKNQALSFLSSKKMAA